MASQTVPPSFDEQLAQVVHAQKCDLAALQPLLQLIAEQSDNITEDDPAGDPMAGLCWRVANLARMAGEKITAYREALDAAQQPVTRSTMHAEFFRVWDVLTLLESIAEPLQHRAKDDLGADVVHKLTGMATARVRGVVEASAVFL